MHMPWDASRHIRLHKTQTRVSDSAHDLPLSDYQREGAREHTGCAETSFLVGSDVEEEWERTMQGLQSLITKRHRERLQTDSLDAMTDYLARLQLDVSTLRVIHVAGTNLYF